MIEQSNHARPTGRCILTAIPLFFKMAGEFDWLQRMSRIGLKRIWKDAFEDG